MIRIDGAYLEGGGQIIRTALALSTITQKPFEIYDIRKGRKDSGLKSQHLYCVKSLQDLCNADVEGAELRRVLLTKGWGMWKRPRRLGKKVVSTPRGLRLRKTVRGRQLSEKTSQVNLAVIKTGQKKLVDIFPDQNKPKENKPVEVQPAEGRRHQSPDASRLATFGDAPRVSKGDGICAVGPGGA